MITGTIRNAVNMQVMAGKWEQKKRDIAQGRNNAEMTAEERQLQMYQEQAEEIREGKKPAEIDTKLTTGAKLTPEEIEYLRRNSPEKLKEYEEIQKERESYKRQLKNCKSKEEVERLKMTRMGQYMSACKQISNNPNIPKGKKLALLQKLQGQVMGVEKEHLAFEKSLQYARLPEEDEKAAKKAKEKAEESKDQEGGVSSITRDPILEESVLENLKELEKSEETAKTGEAKEDSNIDMGKTAAEQVETAEIKEDSGADTGNPTAEQVKTEIRIAITVNADAAEAVGTNVDIKVGGGI